MAALVQTIAVVDKSGKAVSTSKHIVNVFKEAKAAYSSRKAEVVANRQHDPSRRVLHRTLTAPDLEDVHSGTSSRHHHHRSRPSPTHHHHSSTSRSPTSPHPTSPSSPSSPSAQRRHTSLALATLPGPPKRSSTAPSTPTIDMDLAYGPIPPPLPPSSPTDLPGLVNRTSRLLEEFDCLHHSAAHTIAHLQKHPDAMAAVALALAEISNLLRRTAPSVLAALRSSSPAVFALLSSPQFLIAGGVALGVTVVAFGGFKIIKKLREKREGEEPGTVEMLAFENGGSGVGSIESWRRGIEMEGGSVGSAGTSVEGELITPIAARLGSLRLEETGGMGRRRSEDGRSRRNEGSSRRRTRSEEGSDRSRRRSGRSGSKTGSEAGSLALKGRSSTPGGSKVKGEKKAKKPSPLRLMFQ